MNDCGVDLQVRCLVASHLVAMASFGVFGGVGVTKEEADAGRAIVEEAMKGLRDVRGEA